MSHVPRTAGVLVALALLLVAFPGCKRRVPRYGKEFNEQRAQRGIPVIPDSWYISGGVFKDWTGWVNPVFNKGQWDERGGIRASKGVWYDGKQIVAEHDLYYSGRKYKCFDPDGGDDYEKMTVMYSYVAEREGKPAWTVRHDSSEQAASKELSVEEAQSMLRQWGVPQEDIPVLKDGAGVDKGDSL